jgi:glutamate--cysteine ligase
VSILVKKKFSDREVDGRHSAGGEPLTLDDVSTHVESLFCAGNGLRIGLELEFPSFCADGGRPAPELLHTLLDDLALPGGGSITLEPGSAVELSSAPLATVGAAIDAIQADIDCVRRRLETASITLDTAAIDVRREPQRTTMQPRYALLEEHLDRYSPAGRWMMNNTASLQVNISNCIEHPLRQWQLFWQVAPLLNAIFANSPGYDMQGRHWASLRQGCWLAMDPRRVGPVGTSAIGDYVGFALDCPVLLVRTEGQYLPPPTLNMTFGEWILNPSLIGRPATKADLDYHLTTLFPIVRPRGWLELRFIDMVDVPIVEVATTFVAALAHAHTEIDVVAETGVVPSLYQAARFGLNDPEVARASVRLCDIALGVVHAVPGANPGPLGAFCDDFTRRGKCPGSDIEAAVPQPFLPDLSQVVG